MGLASLIYPRTWLNMPGPTDEELKDQMVKWYFMPGYSVEEDPLGTMIRPSTQTNVGVLGQGLYETVEDMMKGIRHALRDEFGQSLADQEFKFAFDEDAK